MIILIVVTIRLIIPSMTIIEIVIVIVANIIYGFKGVRSSRNLTVGLQKFMLRIVFQSLGL